MPAERQPKPTLLATVERGFLLASGAPGGAVRLADGRLVRAWSNAGRLERDASVEVVDLDGGEWCVLSQTQVEAA